jgi:hypothetical protein
MFDNNTRSIVLSIIGWFLVSTISCKKDSPINPGDTTRSILPALTDPIPYEKLGHGKIVFERIR